MPVYKLTTLFTSTSAISTPNSPIHRSGGWSETIYGNFTSIQTLLAEATRQGVPIAGAGVVLGNGYFLARAAMLGIGAGITGARIQQVDVPGPSQTVFLSYSGDKAVFQDIPQMALLIRSPGLGSNAVRRFTLRGIPDTQIIEGEYQPASWFTPLVSQFIASLTAWSFRSKVGAGTPIKIITIGADGTVTAEANPAYSVAQMVRITKTRDSGGNLRSGRFQVVSSGPGATTFKLFNWTFGSTTGGTTRSDAAVTYPSIDVPNTTVSRVVTRRVGRPFVGYRGRRSKRR